MTDKEVTKDEGIKKQPTLNSIIKDIPENKEEKAIEMIRAKKAKKLLDNDKKKLRSLNKCLVKDCNGKLKDFNEEKYLQQGRKNYRLECAECGMLHRMSVFFRDAPGLCEGEITIRTLEFSHRVGHPAKLNDKDLSAWLETEEKKVLDNRSEYQRRDEQIIIRCMNMINKKIDKLIEVMEKK